MVTPTTILNVELDARKAAAVGCDQLAQESAGQRRDDADPDRAFLDPPRRASALQDDFSHLENRDDVVEELAASIRQPDTGRCALE